jgi:hypothetical protein
MTPLTAYLLGIATAAAGAGVAYLLARLVAWWTIAGVVRCEPCRRRFGRERPFGPYGWAAVRFELHALTPTHRRNRARWAAGREHA